MGGTTARPRKFQWVEFPGKAYAKFRPVGYFREDIVGEAQLYIRP